MQTKDEIDILIRARYPILYVESFEEQRVIRLIDEITNQQNKRLLIWSSTTGMTEIDGALTIDDSFDPIAALDIVEQLTEPTIIVLKDFHKYIDDILVYRKLRDVHQNLKSTRKTIIIVAPAVKIPMELQKVITVVSLNLPGKQELNTVLDNVLMALEDSGRDDLGIQKIIHEIDKNMANNRDVILNAGLGLSEDEYENVIAKSIVQCRNLEQGVIIAEKEQIIRKSGILEFYANLANMGDVGGLEALKDWITKRKLAFSPEAKDFGLKLPKGVFLAGPPGTGKSLTAKVIAKYMGMPLLRLDVSKIYGSLVGESEQNITLALKTAEAVAPSVLWLDEVEKALAGTQSSGTTDGGVTSRIFGTFLTWLQEHESPVFVISTSNQPTAIPPEFMRSGRFDAVFMVDLPTEAERLEIFRIHITKAKRDPDMFNDKDYAAFVKQTDGFSGAEIEGVIHDALYNAYFDKKDLTAKYIITAIKATVPLSRKRKDEIDALRTWGQVNAINASVLEKKSKGSTKRRIEIS